MGKVNLGLDDRSARLLHGRDVWSEIRTLLAGTNRISAAIAYVGADADQFLALRGPATIVVNAGDDALTSGSTDPELLLRWTRRGVRVHSLPSLHAKIILVDGDPSFVLVGSADVSWSSANRLDEAVLLADERETLQEARAAIARWKAQAGEPLTEEWLQAAARRARPPGLRQPAVAHLTAAAPDHSRNGGPAGVATEQIAGTATAEPPGAFRPVAVAVGGDVSQHRVFQQGGDTAVQPATAAENPLDGEAVLNGDSAPDAGPAADDEGAAGDAVDGTTADGLGQDGLAADGETDGEVDGRPTDEDGSAEVEPGRPVVWPRPKYIYLALLTTDGRPSDSAVEQLSALRGEFRATDGSGAVDVQLFWSDQPPRQGKPEPTYRPGWHVVPISVPSSGRPAVLSAVGSPGRVVHSFTDYLASPTRTYYYLLSHSAGTPTTFRKLRETLASVQEKPSYDHAFMMQHKVDAILNLWPEVRYTD